MNCHRSVLSAVAVIPLMLAGCETAPEPLPPGGPPMPRDSAAWKAAEVKAYQNGHDQGLRDRSEGFRYDEDRLSADLDVMPKARYRRGYRMGYYAPGPVGLGAPPAAAQPAASLPPPPPVATPPAVNQREMYDLGFQAGSADRRREMNADHRRHAGFPPAAEQSFRDGYMDGYQSRRPQ